MDREASLAALRSGQRYDVIVIGGGASGLGVAVDAQTRGYRTLLVEQDDFAKATSSRSTKLVHGGVRYLQQGNLALVLEALRERGLLCRNAPHLVANLGFIVPRYRWWEGPFYGIGLKLYDLLAQKLNLAPSRILDRDETLRRIPNVAQERLLGGVVYYDAQFDDARLALCLAQTATDHGATVANHVRATALLKEDGLVRGVRVEDVESGEVHEAWGRVVVNAAGIFTDAVRRLDDAAAEPVVAPSQGVHVVLDRSFLRGDTAIMVPQTDDGRVLFVIPWHDRALVGTTDGEVPRAEMEPLPRGDEIAFILRNAARYMERDPGLEDVLSTFAGQRPLVRLSGGKETKKISREHEVVISRTGLVSIMGGKWTTYRKMAQDTVDDAAQVGALPERPCVTESLRLHGHVPAPIVGEGEGVAPWWLRLYGADAALLEAFLDAEPDRRRPLHPRLPYLEGQLRWAVRHEMARTVEDLLSRRTRALLLDARAAMACAPRAAALLAEELGRDEAFARDEAERFVALAQRYLPPGVEDKPEA